ncbi:TetR/AcrR family transcriptional regulator [Mycobacterium sp. MMS18-G62]
MAFDTRPEPVGRGRGRPIGSDSAETRAGILRAAREVINDRGFEAATFQAIAERAGLSRPTMHYYFHTREQIYDSLVEEASSIVADCINEARHADTLLGQLTAFVTSASRSGFGEPSMMRFIIIARLEFHRSPILRHGDGPVVSAMEAFYTSMIEDAIARGEIAPDADTAAIVSMLLAMFLGMGFYAGFVVDGADSTKVAKQLYKLIVRGLLDRSQAVPDRV